jgi:hypothetical protein
MFAKTRKPEEIERYAIIMQKVVEAGVHHPELIAAPNGSMIYRTGNISLALMRFVEGKTFYEIGRAPTDKELKAIIKQATKINKIDYKPPYLFDPWAIPNIGVLFDKVGQSIEPDDLQLV